MQTVEFENHQVWVFLDALEKTLRKVDGLGDAGTSNRVDEIRELLAVISSLRTDAPVGLFSSTMLSQMQATLEKLSSTLDTYADDPTNNPNNIDLALRHLDTVRDQLTLWPRPMGSPQAKAQMTRALNEYAALLDRSRETLQQRLEDALKTATSREQELKEQSDALQEKLDSLTSSIQALDDRIARDEVRLDAALTTTNETFTTSQSAKEKQFKEWLKERETAFGDLANPYLQDLQAAKKAGDSALADINGLRTSVVEMADIAAGDILATQYQTSSKTERTAAYIAYGVGLVGVAAGIIIVLFAFGPLTQPDMPWQQVVLKLSLTLAAGGVATVAFRFGGQAVKRATSFKRQELELRALQPFLKDVAEADTAKIEFLKRSFGHAWGDGVSVKKSPETETNDLLMKLLTAILPAVKTPSSTT